MTFITYGEPGIGEPDDDTLWGSDDTELVKVGLAPDEGLREITIADTWKSKIPSDDLGSAVTSAYMAAVLALVTAREDGEVAMEDVALPPAGSGAAAATAAPHLPRQAPTSSYWYANIDHTSGPVRGYAPDLDGDNVYAIHKVVSPGGGGAAIQAAIREGTGGALRHGMWFASQPRAGFP